MIGFYYTCLIGSKLLKQDPTYPKKKKTLCGVPQGCVLGPLLFLIYIKDIYNASDKLAFYLFADDTNLLFAEKYLKALEIVVNEELMNIYFMTG